MKILTHFCLILTGILLIAVTSCKKSDSSQDNISISQGNRLTSIATVWGGTTYILQKFYYSGNNLDSVTYQNDLDHSYYVFRNTYIGGLLQKVSAYQLLNQKFKPLVHYTVLEYANGIPVTIERENYYNQDTIMFRMIYKYTYNSQGLITGFSESFLEGSNQTLFSQADITYDGSLRKQVRKYNLLKAAVVDMVDDYNWSGNQLVQNVKTYLSNSGSTNYQKYTYGYANNKVSSFTFFQWQSQSWMQMYTTSCTYNVDGNISEEIYTPFSNNTGVVSDLVYTYTQGSPLYRSFILVSNPEWPLDSPVIPSAP